jgi:hypothetical protein
MIWADNDGRLASSGWLVTDAFGQGLQRYWVSGGAVATGRLVDPGAEGSGWWAYATPAGWVVRGAWAAADGTVYLADNDGRLAGGDAGGWVVSAAYGQGMQRYWVDPATHGCVPGYSEAGWDHYTTDDGYILRGKETYGTGVLLADNNGLLATGADMIVTDIYDGDGPHRYFLTVLDSDTGMVGAKVGYFTFQGSEYLGLKRYGYLIINDYAYANDRWYYADKDARLTVRSSATLSAIDRYIDLALSYAADDSHGYDQEYRWGPDYDCSSFVVTMLQDAGFDTAWATYTGNLRSALESVGWQWCAMGTTLRRGDILLNETHHVSMYVEDDTLVMASSNEFHGATGGATGDQTGREIYVRNYYDYPWNGILRLAI